MPAADCTRRCHMSARRGLSKTGWPRRPSKSIRDSATGYAVQGRGQIATFVIAKSDEQGWLVTVLKYWSINL